jgi:hypothetical protein
VCECGCATQGTTFKENIDAVPQALDRERDSAREHHPGRRVFRRHPFVDTAGARDGHDQHGGDERLVDRERNDGHDTELAERARHHDHHDISGDSDDPLGDNADVDDEDDER